MKWRKILALTAVAALLPVLGAAKPETNTNINTNTNDASKGVTVHGQLKTKLHLQASEVAGAKKWMDTSLQLALVNLDKSINDATDPSQKSMLQDTKKQMLTISNDKLLTRNSDGTADINGYLRDVQVTIDGQTVTTDKKGNYKIKGIGKGKKDIQFSYQENSIDNKTEDVNSDTTADLDITVTSNDVNKALSSMGDMPGTGQSARYYPAGIVNGDPNHLSRMTPADINPYYGFYAYQWNGSTPLHFYPKCNEAFTDSDSTGGWYYDNWRTDAGMYFLGSDSNSDCARNIYQGEVLYSQSFDDWYHMSYYCWIESINEAMDHAYGPNFYCNGKWVNWQVNCSWFNGVDEPEELHTGW